LFLNYQKINAPLGFSLVEVDQLILHFFSRLLWVAFLGQSLNLFQVASLNVTTRHYALKHVNTRQASSTWVTRKPSWDRYAVNSDSNVQNAFAEWQQAAGS